LVVSGDAFGEEELFSGDAGGAVLPFECDPVGAFLGPRALPGGHHQPAIARAGPPDSGITSCPVDVASAGKNRAPPGLVVYTCPDGAVEMTVPSDIFL